MKPRATARGFLVSRTGSEPLSETASPDHSRVRRILLLAMPIITGMVSQNLFNLVDTAMVGYLGNAALAAVGLGGFVVFMCQALLLGMSTGVQATAARRKGEGKSSRAARSLNTAILMIAIVAPLLSVLLITATPYAYPLLNTDPAVIDVGVGYLQWRLAAIVFVGINFSFRGYWNAMSMSRLYMYTLVAMHVCNITLNYVLIFGKFGFPALGVEGAGIASALSVAIGTVVYLALGLQFARRQGFLTGLCKRRETLSLIRISIPSSVQQVLFAASFVLMFVIIGMIGTAELAVANVLIQVTLFAILPGLALGLACTTLVSEALGRNDVEDAYRWAWDVARVALVLLTVLGLPMLLAANFVASLFLHDAEARELALWPMRMVGLIMPAEALGFTFMHALLGAGDSKRVMIVSAVVQWALFLPVAYWVGPVLDFGLLAVWLAQGGSRILLAAAFVTAWRSRRWQHIRV